MRKHRFTTLLLTAIMLFSVGCVSERTKSGPTPKRVTSTVLQTGSNIGRRVEVPASAEASPGNQREERKQAKAKPKRTEVDEDIVSGSTTKRVTSTVLQTGSNIGRRVEVPASAEASSGNQREDRKQAKAKPKRTEVDEDIVTRGGFR
jgi:hypothetical protein